MGDIASEWLFRTSGLEALSTVDSMLQVSLFSNRSQMTSKCGTNKNVAHELARYCRLYNNPSYSRIFNGSHL